MNNDKSIYACYEEIKRREIRELKEAVRNAGRKVSFDEDDAPIVMCNFNGMVPHPADVRITRVELRDEGDEDVLYVFGKEKCASGYAEWFDDETEIHLSDIAYGHIKFITSSVTIDTEVSEPEFFSSAEFHTPKSEWVGIDVRNNTWEYQRNPNDDETYVSGSYEIDYRYPDTVIGYDGCFELPQPVILALKGVGYKIDL